MPKITYEFDNENKRCEISNSVPDAPEARHYTIVFAHAALKLQGAFDFTTEDILDILRDCGVLHDFDRDPRETH